MDFYNILHISLKKYMSWLKKWIKNYDCKFYRIKSWRKSL